MEATNLYIYQIPYLERKRICDILDTNNKWKELALSHMKFGVADIKKFKEEIASGNSPTNKLLDEWGRFNHNILELFILLHRIDEFEAMSVIKDFVATKYHYLFNSNDPTQKILNVDKCNRLENTNIMSKVNNEPFLSNSDHLASTIARITHSTAMIPHIPYEELELATNNWDEVNLLGVGGFGKVFKGIWKYTEVAVKRIQNKENNPKWHRMQLEQTVKELQCLSAFRHDNILPVYGYSIKGPHPCLIYKYMAGGSLESRLKEKDPEKILKWPTRKEIALGTARGIQFLHTSGENGLVHGDIKSANILLDLCNIPRIGDFGLAQKSPQNDYTKLNKLQGTPPYLPEEFLRSRKFSTKVDTYSFGVVLFELATSMRAVIKKDQKDQCILLRDYVFNYVGDLLDLKATNAPGYNDCFLNLIYIGKECVHRFAKQRPTMVSVMKQLENVPL